MLPAMNKGCFDFWGGRSHGGCLLPSHVCIIGSNQNINQILLHPGAARISVSAIVVSAVQTHEEATFAGHGALTRPSLAVVHTQSYCLTQVPWSSQHAGTLPVQMASRCREGFPGMPAVATSQRCLVEAA